jgi:type IX secretion system substrate protein
MQSSSQCVTSATALDSVKIVRNAVTGIIDVDFPATLITAYPNPFTTDITVKGLQFSGDYIIHLMSGSGAIIKMEHVQRKSTVILHNLHLHKGTYFLRLYDKKKNRLVGTMTVIGL